MEYQNIKVYKSGFHLATFEGYSYGGMFLKFKPIDGKGEAFEIPAPRSDQKFEPGDVAEYIGDLELVNEDSFVSLFNFQGKPYEKTPGVPVQPAKIGTRKNLHPEMYRATENGWIEIDGEEVKQERDLWYTLLHAGEMGIQGEEVYRELDGYTQNWESVTNRYGNRDDIPDGGIVIGEDERITAHEDGYYVYHNHSNGYAVYKYDKETIHKEVGFVPTFLEGREPIKKKKFSLPYKGYAGITADFIYDFPYRESGMPRLEFKRGQAYKIEEYSDWNWTKIYVPINGRMAPIPIPHGVFKRIAKEEYRNVSWVCGPASREEVLEEGWVIIDDQSEKEEKETA